MLKFFIHHSIIAISFIVLSLGLASYNQVQAQEPGSFDDGVGGDWCGGVKCPNDFCGLYDGFSGGYFEYFEYSLACWPGDYFIPPRCSSGESTSVDCETTEEENPYPDQSQVCFPDNGIDGENGGCIGGTYCVIYKDPAMACFENWGTWLCCDTVDPSPSPVAAPSPTPEAADGVVVDIKADGSDGPIVEVSMDPLASTWDFILSWESWFADDCTLNGSAVNLNDSSAESVSTFGSHYYDLDCTNAVDSGSDSIEIYAVPETCGNGVCAGFETCETCEVDCGVCPTSFAWWQVINGHAATEASSGFGIFSRVPGSDTCIEPSCVPSLMTLDSAITLHSDGFPMTAGGTVSSDGEMITYRNPVVTVIGTTLTRFRETYSYFYSKYSLGFSPFDDYIASAGDALEPGASKDAYFHSGNMTIQSPWDVSDGESYVIFVDGDLNIEDPSATGELITVAEGGFLAFIVSGDINIADTVGHSTLTNTAGNIEGVYVADGTITINSNGAADNRFIGEGTFVGWNDVVILRDYNDDTNNDLYPTETFTYRPDLVKNTPEKMKRAQMLWQETN